MFNKIKTFISEHPLEIALSIGLIGVAIVATRSSSIKTAMSGGAILEIPGAAVKDLLEGKEILLDCLEDAHLLITYIPKA